MAEKPASDAPTRGSWWTRTSLRLKIILGVVLAVIVIGLAVGLGVGLTIGRNNGGGEGEPSATGSPLPTPTGTLPWTPKVNDTWQIILLNNMLLSDNASSVTPDVDIYDIDLFSTNTSTISTLHRLGKKVICYFSAGSSEDWRPDFHEFEEKDMGHGLDGWPGERWLDLNSTNVRRIMKNRIQMAKDKACDGVDPDNIDGYNNKNGLNLTPNDSVNFMSYLSNITQSLNLTMGLKNAGEIIPIVLPIVHFSVNEECVKFSECTTFTPFIDAGKPVFHIEYPDGAGSDLKADTVQKICSRTGAADGSADFSTVMKKMNLDGWVEYCDQKVAVTSINATDPSGNGGSG